MMKPSRIWWSRPDSFSDGMESALDPFNTFSIHSTRADRVASSSLHFVRIEETIGEWSEWSGGGGNSRLSFHSVEKFSPSSMRTLTLRLSDVLLFDKSPLARASSSEDVILSSLECLALLLSSTVASKASLNSSNSFSNTGSSSLIAFPASLSSLSASFDTGVSAPSFSILSAIRMNNSASSDLSADASAIGSMSDVNGSFFFSKMSIVRLAFSNAALRSNISFLLSKFI